MEGRYLDRAMAAAFDTAKPKDCRMCYGQGKLTKDGRTDTCPQCGGSGKERARLSSVRPPGYLAK